MSEGRFALLVATGRYDNSSLRRLRSPARDAKGLAAVLADPRIGDFAVRKVTDGRNGEVSRAIESFFHDRGTRDLLLLHMSCHGIKNDDGELYFAARDTEPELLDSTAVSAAFLRTQMHRCRARSIVVLLDCCYSGAFLPDFKGDTAVHVTERLRGSGRVVLTATNRFEYAWEGNRPNELAPESSWFTRAVIEGLRTGRADRDGDGFVSVDELYAYVYEHMLASRVKQRPQRWSALEYQVLIARSAAQAPAPARPWPAWLETAGPVPVLRDEHLRVDPYDRALPSSVVRTEPPGPIPPAGERGGRDRATPSGVVRGDRGPAAAPAAAPPVWGRVPRRNARFTGRELLLDDLRRLLEDAGPSGTPVTLPGMVGVGKTQLALEYAHRFQSAYDVVWWVSAETRTVCREGLAGLAPALGLATGAELGERLRAVHDALRRGDPYTRWLLVFDGADEPDEIAELVPAGAGHVLITSRNPEWAEHGSRLLEVPQYGREESVTFVHGRAPRLTESEADRLAGLCHDLPLLLDQTAGWLNDVPLSLDEYAAHVRNGFDPDAVKVSADYPSDFRTAGLRLLLRLKESAPEALELLRLFTFFAPGSVFAELVRGVRGSGLPSWIEAMLVDPLKWHRTVNILRKHAVVSVATDGKSLYLHPLLHQVVHTEMPEPDRLLLRDAVHRGLAAADPREPSDARTWPDYARILPHLRSADVCTSGDPDVQGLILNCLRYLRFSGGSTAGLSLADETLRIWRRLFGEGHWQVWALTHQYAGLLRATGNYSGAVAIEQSAADGLMAQLDPENPEYLHAVLGQTADLRNMARYSEAVEVSQKVLTTCRRVLGDADALSLAAASGVGSGLALLGLYNEALEVDHATLAARRGLVGERHPSTLFSELSYATDLRLLGRYGQAAQVQERNLREHHLVLGADHPQSLWAGYHLALCHYRNGHPDQAREALTEVVERSARILGDGHPHTLAFASCQSCFSREYGDIDRALELGESVIAGYAAVHDEGHPCLAGCRANHALSLDRLGDRERAHALAEQALREMSAAVGENHPWTLGCAINASTLRGLVGDEESAAELGRDTVERASAALGTLHPLTLSARIALAGDLRALRDGEQADRVEEEALRGFTAGLGPQHPLTVAARSRRRLFWDFDPPLT
ncbi:FxSxx-COOH system tetratricopeptide repeat protein [Streptomyces mangrovisoli]|uniref:EF-hand domain-containing protein n=1 Tax=Streptomyces mangrovisoli TaxID=1428628 RepID=A0A1J4P340_9ACTN|nr:FxSxx-COOH system tetratricopeptide repeat protein [Streptomyces mangrovisoli]OIJ68172.1 hypothetical protein WN71_009005 [Streptomyces mangrovisoli]